MKCLSFGASQRNSIYNLQKNIQTGNILMDLTLVIL